MAEKDPGQPRPGTWYLVPTTFADDGTLDLASQGRLVDAAVAWGVDGLTVMGVMSEPGALGDTERTTVLKAIFAAAGGRVPITVGCSAASPALVLERIREARDLGAAAAMVAAPPLLRNVDQLPRFFEAVAAGGLPLVIQDEPAATGVSMPVSVLLSSAAASGSVCIKVEDPPTPAKIGQLLAARADLTLFGGLGGVSAFHEMTRGAAGTMTGFAYPEVMRAIRLAIAAGQPAAGARLFRSFLPLIVFEAQVGVGLLIRKEVLRRRGAISSARSRAISPRLDATTAGELDAVLALVGLEPSIDPLDLMAAT
ncbi:MAG: 4-hydroxy-tetrahydrodipicolinate synthase [Chloroflexota bacterium]|jgi:4-hydroxy-tetrahydrodipicolinate synthase|nr:4-hydroxy-tetrahydrodipicolinate synthase [Chloroflexota bacterium]